MYLVRRLVRLVHHHLVVQLVADDELVRQLHAVRLHGVRWPIVELPDLGVVHVGHAMLDERAGRHGGVCVCM